MKPALRCHFVLKTLEAERAKFSGSYIDSTLAGGAVAVLSVGGIGDGDAADSARSSRERVRSMQDWIEDAGAKAKERILNAWRDSC